MPLNRDFVKPPVKPGYHVYEGVPFPPMVLPSTLDAMKTWKLRSDDIIFASYPRSGSHWMFEILNLIANGGDRSKIDRSHMVIAPEMPEMTYGSPFDSEGIRSAPPGYQLMEGWKSPRVIGTHLPEQLLPPDAWEKKLKIVYMLRNPKDVFCSMYPYALQYQPPDVHEFENFVKFNLLSERPFGTWFQHVLGYAKHRDEDNFKIVKYEDLKKDLLGEMKRIVRFLDRPLSDQLVEKIAAMTELKEMKKAFDKHEKEDPKGLWHTSAFGKLYFVNKGTVGRWKEKFSDELNELFNEIFEEKMAGSGIEIEFEI